jgi:hypothetical protein
VPSGAGREMSMAEADPAALREQMAEHLAAFERAALPGDGLKPA